MLGGLLFRLMRFFELLTLIPIIGMLSWFVNAYVTTNQLTPDYILVLFIVSTLAGAWALVTLFKMDSVRRNAPMIAFIDLCFVGAFIAGVYYLRFITQYDCVNVLGSVSSQGGFSATAGNGAAGVTWPNIQFSGPFGIDYNKSCAMLKASFAFGIMNCLFFAATAFLATFIHRKEKAVVVEKTYSRRGSHSSR